MNELIPIIQVSDTLVADSRNVATALQIRHESFLATLDTHCASVEAEFGRVRFEIGTLETAGGKQRTRFAYLTEDQSLFLATLSRNSAPVVRVKAWLVKAFKAARESLVPTSIVPALPQDYIEALEALVVAKKAEKQLALQVAEMEPKAAFFDAVTDSKDAIEMAAVAKVLAIPSYGRTKLFAFLRERKILRKSNQPLQEYIDRGYFRVIVQKWQTPDGETKMSTKTLVFAKGLDYIRSILPQ